MPDEPYDLFGWGHNGRLPEEVRRRLEQPGEPERIAGDAIRTWLAEAEKRQTRATRRPAESAKKMAVDAYILMQFFAEERVPPPPVVQRMFAVALGLVSPESGETVSGAPLEEYGYPHNVKRSNMQTFLRAAQLEGEGKAWGEPWSNLRLAQHLNISPPTLREWQKSPAYQRRRKFSKHSLALQASVYARWNLGRPRGPG